MGLLDDAIRDHLELKRNRGADPTEIAREEREALEPVFPDEPRPAGFGDEPQAGTVLDEEPPHGDPLVQAPATTQAPHDLVAAQPVGEETAELDMQAVLAEDPPERDASAADSAGPDDTSRAQPMRGPDPVRAPPQGEEDLLEWEIPGRVDAEPPPEPLPGQERMSFE